MYAEIEVPKLLEILNSSEVPSSKKHQIKNAFINQLQGNSPAITELRTIVNENESYISRSLLLDSELKILNFDYLTKLLINGKQRDIVGSALKRHKFLFSSTFADVNYLGNIFQNISYSFRLRIITQIGKYCKDEARCEDIFNSVLNRYGMSSAIELVTGCPIAFISKLIETEICEIDSNIEKSDRQRSTRFEFTDSQLSLIFNKNSELAIKYLKFFSSPALASVLKRILKFDSKIFVQLFIENEDVYKNSLKLSGRLTKFLLRKEEEIVKANFKSFGKILDKITLFNYFGIESYADLVVLPSFPKSPSEFSEYNIAPLKDFLLPIVNSKSCHLSHFAAGDIFKKLFKQIYKDEMKNYPELASKTLLELLPPDEREVFIEHKILTESYDELLWISYRDTSKSIPHFKNLIASESDHYKRQTLLVSLVSTCLFNKDLAALEEVIAYFLLRHKNERGDSINRFFDEIYNMLIANSKQMPSPKLLASVTELLKLAFLNEKDGGYWHYKMRIVEAVYSWSLKSKMPTDWVLSKLLTIKIEEISGWRNTWTSEIEDLLEPEGRIELIKKIINYYNEMEETGMENENKIPPYKLTVAILDELNKIRSKSATKLYSICEISEIMGLIKQVYANEINSQDERIYTQVVDFLLMDPHLKKSPDNEIYQLCFEKTPTQSLILYFLRTKPSVLFENNELKPQFFNQLVAGRNENKLLLLFMRLGMNSVLEQIKKESISVLALEENLSFSAKRSKSIKSLSLLATPQIFYDFATKYFPKDTKINLSEINTKNESSFRTASDILLSLKNLSDLSIAFKILVNFTSGDYLKLTLGALYSLATNGTLKDVNGFLETILKVEAISIKKHGVRLYLLLNPMSESKLLISSLIKTEKHSTTRFILLKEIFKKIRDDETYFPLLASLISNLEAHDKDSLGLLYQLQQVKNIQPINFESYVDSCMGAFLHLKENLRAKNGNDSMDKMMNHYMTELISRCVMNLTSGITPTWFNNFVKKYLINDEANSIDIKKNISELVVNFLFSSKDEMSKCSLAIIEDLLSQDITKESYPVTKILVFSIFDRVFDENEKIRLKAAQTIKMIKKIKALNEGGPFNFSLRLFLEYYDKIGELGGHERKIGQAVSIIMDEFLKKYGTEYFSLLRAITNNFILNTSRVTSLEAKLDFMIELLGTSGPEYKKEKIMYVIGDFGLFSEKPKGEANSTKYEEILKIISASNDPIVKIYYDEWTLSNEL